MGGFEAVTPVVVEPSVEYHPLFAEILTRYLESGTGTLSGLFLSYNDIFNLLIAHVGSQELEGLLNL
jgi:hypothetical protein